MRARIRRWQNSIFGRGELPAQNLAFGFELRQRDLDVAQRQAQRAASAAGVDGPDRIHPSAQDRRS